MGLWKKVRKAVVGGLIGGLPGAALAQVVGGNLEKQQQIAKDAAAEQQRANDEARAIAAAQGGTQIVDNTSEMLTSEEENLRRRGYLSTLRSRAGNSLLAATGYGKKNLGD